jgi:hypothetical protein
VPARLSSRPAQPESSSHPLFQLPQSSLSDLYDDQKRGGLLPLLPTRGASAMKGALRRFTLAVVNLHGDGGCNTSGTRATS